MPVKLCVAGQAFPVGPLRAARYLIGGVDGLPFRRRNYSDEIAFYDHLPRLLRLIAARTANELIPAHLHAAAGLGSRVTTDDYIGFLIMAYLVELVPAWSKNLTTKVKRHAKVHICDTGLAAFLLGK